jgi:hypothetical protein
MTDSVGYYRCYLSTKQFAGIVTTANEAHTVCRVTPTSCRPHRLSYKLRLRTDKRTARKRRIVPQSAFHYEKPVVHNLWGTKENPPVP